VAGPDPRRLQRDYYTHWVTDRIRFSDTDQVGHVNNLALAAYVETGRLYHSRDVLQPLLDGEGGFILARVEIDFVSELHFGGQVDVGTRVVRMGRSSLTVGTGVFGPDGRCAVVADSIVAHLGPHGTAPLPDDLRARIGALLPEASSSLS
jgi:acyl-CoA thioester hydrolase